MTCFSVRAAFDVGSGQTKVSIARVDGITGRPSEILFAEETSLLLGHDLEKNRNGCLSDAILNELRKILVRYRDIARSYNADKLSGIATAVFRESNNGGNFIRNVHAEMGIALNLVSQTEEGELGFLTALAASSHHRTNLVAWDSGGASFQITTEGDAGFEVYEGPWGASKALAAMVERVQNKDFRQIQTANPVSRKEVFALDKLIRESLPSVPLAIKRKLADPATMVVAIGGPYSPFNMAAIATGSARFSRKQVLALLTRYLGESDRNLAQFPEPEMFIPRLILMHAVMEKFDILRVDYRETTGSTLGILMSPRFW